jgi:hypothetical protein
VAANPVPTADTLDVFFQTAHAARLVVLEATERDVLGGKNARRGVGCSQRPAAGARTRMNLNADDG